MPSGHTTCSRILPGAKVSFVGERKGSVRTAHKSLGLEADFAIDEVTRADVLLVPGDIGEEAVRLVTQPLIATVA